MIKALKNKTLNIALVLTLAIGLSAGFIALQPSTTQAQFLNQESAPEKSQIIIKKDDGDELLFTVEMASRPDQQAKGLMNREYMGENEGMLFVFNDVGHRSFWMKDTLIPLDILFLEKDGTIHHIHHNAQPLNESYITAQRPSKAVLELNGGTADAMGIEVGDKIHHKIFRNMNLLAD